jgi:hypothetical protein
VGQLEPTHYLSFLRALTPISTRSSERLSNVARKAMRQPLRHGVLVCIVEQQEIQRTVDTAMLCRRKRRVRQIALGVEVRDEDENVFAGGGVRGVADLGECRSGGCGEAGGRQQ